MIQISVLSTQELTSGSDGLTIAQDNIAGALFILDRINGPGVSGHIKDEVTGKPLEANYKILEIYNDIIATRMSDSLYGRYDRLLQAGNYTLQVSKEGYETETIQGIQVQEGAMTEIEVLLKPIISSIDELEAWPYNGNMKISQNFPNPFHSTTSIKYSNNTAGNISIRVFDLYGKEVISLVDSWHSPGDHVISWNGNNTFGQRQSPGFYIYQLISDAEIHTRKMMYNH
jgi:hypothetical protein